MKPIIASMLLFGCSAHGGFDLASYGKTDSDHMATPNDGVNDASQIQAALNTGRRVELARGIYNTDSPLYLTASSTMLSGQGAMPAFGADPGGGTRIVYSGTGPAVVIDSRGMPANTGLSAFMENLSVIGGGVRLIGDESGETNFVQGSRFRNVTVRGATGHGWEIVGTCFLNSFDGCSASYCSGDGLRITPLSGTPTNNNFIHCLYADAGGYGANLMSGNRKEAFTACNISQNALGGVRQDSGYTAMADCDFEGNVGPAISILNAGSGTRVSGGCINKTPGGAARVGISVGVNTANVYVDGILFCNYDHADDRLAAFSGGTLGLFDYRLQSCAGTVFPEALWTNVARMPQFSWTNP